MQTTRQELGAQQRLAAQPPSQASSPLIDRHEDADEATFVLWSRGRLKHICDGDTSLNLRLCTVIEAAALAVEEEQYSTQACIPTGNADCKRFCTSSSC